MHKWLMALVLFWVAYGASAASFRVGFGTHKPPYVFQSEGRGLEYDIVAAALRSAGYQMEAYFAPMERLHLMLRRGEIDCIATTNELSGEAAYYSDVYILYQNVAAALAARELRIEQIADLGRYSVSAFQRARFLLGPEFQSMASANANYREEAQQVTRNRLLYSGRIEVVIGDIRVIRYLNREVQDQVDTTQGVTWYPLFAPTAYRLGFRFQIQRDMFNRGLSAIRETGEYAAIEARYAEY